MPRKQSGQHEAQEDEPAGNAPGDGLRDRAYREDGQRGTDRRNREDWQRAPRKRLLESGARCDEVAGAAIEAHGRRIEMPGPLLDADEGDERDGEADDAMHRPTQIAAGEA